MSKPSLDCDSVVFSEARRLGGGIEVVGQFIAPKVSNPKEGEEHYLITFTINPITKVVHKGATWELKNRSYNGPKDKLRELEKQVGDLFIQTIAWEILSKREPDPSYVIDEVGKVIPSQPLIRRKLQI
jgi:hypothetical protein